LQLGGLGIFGPGGTAAQLGLRGEVAVAPWLLPTLNGGILRTLAGPVRVRDLQLGARLLPVRDDALVIAVEPGLSVPLGSVGADAGPLPTTSGSVDPTLKADVVAGGQVLGLFGVQAQFPIVEGRDGLRQGPFARADLRGALRQGIVVPWLGMSGLRQAPHANGGGSLWELAAVAGAVVEISDTTGLAAQVRVPVWTDATERYWVAPGLAVRQVIGRKVEDAH